MCRASDDALSAWSGASGPSSSEESKADGLLKGYARGKTNYHVRGLAHLLLYLSLTTVS